MKAATMGPRQLDKSRSRHKARHEAASQRAITGEWLISPVAAAVSQAILAEISYFATFRRQP